jgi:hypothetical protein
MHDIDVKFIDVRRRTIQSLTYWCSQAASCHRFGGHASHSGTRFSPKQPAATLLFTLDLTDPPVSFNPPALKTFPIYFACSSFVEFCYRVLSDKAIKILANPYPRCGASYFKDWPRRLPRAWGYLGSPDTFNPLDPREYFDFRKIFGGDLLSAHGESILKQRIAEEVGADADAPADTLDEWLDDQRVFDPGYDNPERNCPNKTCDNHGIAGSMELFLLVKPTEGKALKRAFPKDVWQLVPYIVYQYCPSCYAIVARWSHMIED